MVVAATLEQGPSWMDPYIAFLSDGSLPEDKKEATRVQTMAAYFWLFDDKNLY